MGVSFVRSRGDRNGPIKCAWQILLTSQMRMIKEYMRCEKVSVVTVAGR